MSDLTIAEARWPHDHDAVLGLFRDYVAGLGIDLGFQGVEAEFATLPGKYARPHGLVLLARRGGAAVGTVAYRPYPPGGCEMKRLYVAPAARGLGAGRQLCDRLITEARAAGYRRMLLDTGDWLTAALALYRALGFAEIPAYYHNPLKGTVYMARDLQD
ncbi:MAG TPA: GNAT family N-acetyltransferase [Stellaceae bacterium]